MKPEPARDIAYVTGRIRMTIDPAMTTLSGVRDTRTVQDSSPVLGLARIARGKATSPAYEAAEQTLISKGRSFHWARHLLGATHADRATRLYGFCRRVDDLVDESRSPDIARAALQTLDRDLCAGMSSDPLTADAIRLIAECGIDRTAPRLLIAGVASDLGPVRIQDEAALLRYCYHVAGTVGLMMCGALDVSNLLAIPHAIDLGIAMQLTNLCRDVHEDAQAGRRYLPASLVGDMAPEQLVAPAPADFARAQAAILVLLDLADTYYASGEAGLPYLPARARGAICVAGRIYRSIGLRLRRRSADAWPRRAMVPPAAKAAISLAALLSSSLRLQPGLHKSALHAALAGLHRASPQPVARHG